MHELKQELEEIAKQIETAIAAVDIASLASRLTQLEQEMQAEGFWNNNEHAQSVSQEASHLRENIESWKKLKNNCAALVELFPSVHPEENPDGAQEFHQMFEQLQKDWHVMEIHTFLNQKYDKNNAIITIHAGTGGKDAQDFAEMLLRMYLRYAEKNGWEAKILDRSPGEEVGIKSVTFEMIGPFAYGYVKSENGVHRLVRLSPFNSQNSRETSFVLVEVLPELHEDQHIEIKDDELRVDTYRSSGPGGQNVNKVDSAVRITHIPTGIVIACQSERSQLQNKEHAMKILRAKLADLMEQEQAETLQELKGGKKEIAWGSQIRSYVLHPYKLVKDHRTDHEETNAEAVLDGELDGFIEAFLKR